MSLMSSLYVGVSGLNVSQNGLNTTGLNLANVETEGFVRQQTVLQTSQYNTIGQTYISKMQTGLGVEAATVRQVRDMFLDKSYRTELGRQGFYDSQYETATEVENLFGEINGVAFQDSISNLWSNLEELAKEPDNLVTRASLVQTCVSFVERSENIYKQLSDYQINLNQKISEQVSRINDIGDELVELNDKICYYESNQLENANDLRDTRNSLLDELGQMVSITYKENAEGRVTVNVEGMPFVTEEVTMHMSTMTVTEIRRMNMGDEAFYADESGIMENSEMLIPIWPTYGSAEVYNRDLVPTSVNDTDVGSLKGILLARGTKVGKYTDIPIEPNKDDYLDEDGELLEEEYTAAVTEYEEAVKTYNEKIDPSIVMTTQAQFDQLMHGIVTTMNNILCPNKEVTLTSDVTVTLSDGTERTYEAGSVVKIFDEENAPVGLDGPPGTAGEEIFSRKSMSRYADALEEDLYLEDGTVISGARIYNEEDPNNNYSMYTVGELTVNQAVIENQSKIPLSQNTNTGDYDIEKVQELVNSWQEPFASLDPNTVTKNTFKDYYTYFISGIGTKGEKFKTIADSQSGMVQSIDDQRQSVQGVSSDEELTNMIKFQHAYNAAARYVNVIDEMLEHIVTRL